MRNTAAAWICCNVLLFFVKLFFSFLLNCSFVLLITLVLAITFSFAHLDNICLLCCCFIDLSWLSQGIWFVFFCFSRALRDCVHSSHTFFFAWLLGSVEDLLCK